MGIKKLSVSLEIEHENKTYLVTAYNSEVHVNIQGDKNDSHYCYLLKAHQQPSFKLALKGFQSFCKYYNIKQP